MQPLRSAPSAMTPLRLPEHGCCIVSLECGNCRWLLERRLPPGVRLSQSPVPAHLGPCAQAPPWRRALYSTWQPWALWLLLRPGSQLARPVALAGGAFFPNEIIQGGFKKLGTTGMK